MESGPLQHERQAFTENITGEAEQLPADPNLGQTISSVVYFCGPDNLIAHIIMG